MFGLGIPELLILSVLLIPVAVAFMFLAGVRRRAKRLGYSSVRAYLRAVPRTDEERRDAGDLALRGLVLCAFGLFFAPIMLAGVIPLYFGGRKVVYALMGLGLVDDRERPGA